MAGKSTEGGSKAKKKYSSSNAVIDTFVVIPQRVGVCDFCLVRYTGSKDAVHCYRCGRVIKTKDVNAFKKVPSGVFTPAGDVPYAVRIDQNEGDT